MQDNLKSILIVDDEEDLRDALAFDFKRQGFNVFLAENGKVAYQIIQKENVSVVLSDVRMAGGDGIELLKNIKTTHPGIPVVLSTGFAEIGIDEAYELGASAVILKPFERQLLKETVHKALLPFSSKVLSSDEFLEPIHHEIVVDQRLTDTNVIFGSVGFAFWWDSGKIKDKMNLKIHLKTKQFNELVVFATVKYVSVEDQTRNQQRVGVEPLRVIGSGAENFTNWIQESQFVSSIPR